MASTPRTLDAISAKIRGDLRRELPGTDATVWPNNLSIFAKVFALAVHELDLRFAWAYRQIFASTADARHLERHAYEYGLARKGASRATGEVTTTGDPDTVYPAGIGYWSDGALYRSAGEALSGGDGSLTLTLVAETAGAAMNRDTDETLTLADPALYPTLDAEATVGADGIGGGADTETDASLRARVLDRKRRPPQGGAASDYEQMARAVPGVTKAWAWPFANGPGTVGVWFLFEGRDNGIPTASDVLAVRTQLEARRLIRAGLSVSAPIPQAVDVTISGLSPDTQTVRAAVEASLATMLAERGRPGVASSPFVLSRSWIGEAISIAVGEGRHELVDPPGDVTFVDGRMPVLGTVTYE